VWGPSGAKYQAFKEAPYKDDFDEWLARIVCFAFSLPPTAFARQVNRATAETAQDAAQTEGLAPLMGWVKRLADQVIQDVMGEADLEFAWGDVRPADPAEQARIIDTYVRSGVYAVNEARAVLGLAPVPGGERPMIYGAQGAVPLDGGAAPPLGKAGYNPAEPRVPKGETGGGEWTDGGGATIRPAQEFLPFAARPPLIFDEPPNEVTRPFKEPVPRLSGKEGAKDVPDWARGNRPYVGERGRDFAKRTMDNQYGKGKWQDNPDR
jgi:hypothetical protein